MRTTKPSWTRNLFSRLQSLREMLRGLQVRSTRRFGMECLEDRTVPSVYDLEVIARGGLDGLSAVGPNISINDAGKIAFVGNDGDGPQDRFQDLFVGGESPGQVRNITNNKSQYIDYGQSAQINNIDQIVVRYRDIHGIFEDQIRVWNGTPGATRNYTIIGSTAHGDFDTVGTNASLSDDGFVVYSAITGAFNTLERTSVIAPDATRTTLGTYPNPRTFRPMVAGGGVVVVRDGAYDDERDPIHLYGGGPLVSIAKGADFNARGQRPGISDDGRIVTFYGELTQAGAAHLTVSQPANFAPLTPGPGVFVSIDYPKVGRVIQRVAGISGNGYRDPGETVDDAGADKGPIGGFVANARVGVNTTWDGKNPGVFTVVFQAMRPDGVEGVYTALLSIDPNAPIVARPVIVSEISPVIQVGDSLPDGAGTVTSLTLYDPINIKGQVAVWADNGSGGVVLRANPIRTPILLVPGIVGTYTSTPLYKETWLMTRGVGPTELQIDPFLHVYDAMIQTFQNAGYTLYDPDHPDPKANLYVANYDWRLPVAPADGTFDGSLVGVTATGITDGTFDYGVDYLGYWLKKAADNWASAHQNAQLESVNVVAHSMGGLLTRAYIQSGAYGGDDNLPKINQFVTVGTPHQGATKPWAILNDDWNSDYKTYGVFVSRILSMAYRKVMAGSTVFGPGGEITKTRIEDGKDPGTSPVGPLPPERKDAQRHMNFIRLYCPSLTDLLAIYPIGIPDNLTSKYQNALLLDLNGGDYKAGATGDRNSFAERTTAAVVYSGSEETITTVTREVGPTYVGGDLFRTPKLTILPMTDLVPRSPEDTEVWYSENEVVGGGDGTVPVISGRDPFRIDRRVTLKEVVGSHTEIMSTQDAERFVLFRFGLSLPDYQIVSGNSQSNAAIGLAMWIDPVETVLTDAAGRRLGYTAVTGPLTEIPDSVWLGGADGFGWVLGAVEGPTRLTLSGLGGDYSVQVMGINNPLIEGIDASGTLAAGQTLILDVPVPAKSVQILDGTAVVTPETVIDLGRTDRGGGRLTRTLTIKNTGTDVLNLGTVLISGQGYSVTQPSLTSLASGTSTTIIITLSDETVGAGLIGSLTIPTNAPFGPGVIQLRGQVVSHVRVTAVTRLDPGTGTGPMVVAVDFSERLLPGPANDRGNFAIALGGTGVPIASAVYSEDGGVYRVTLMSAVSGWFAPGEYDVRFDGTQIRDLAGNPVTTQAYRLAVLDTWTNSLVTIAPDSSGVLQVDGPVMSLGGAGPPRELAGSDFNGDGYYDLVTASEETGELLFFYGRPEGGFEDPVSLPLPRASATPNLPVLPKSLTVADWNGDGRPDLVFIDAGSTKRIFIYLNDGARKFSPAPDTPIPAASSRLDGIFAVGDFTGDGSIDIAANVGVEEPGTFWGYIGAVGIYGKDPFLGYTQVAVLPTVSDGWFPNTAAVGDLNGDGRPDLVVATSGYYGANPGVVAYLSTPTGLAAAQKIDYDGFNPPNSVSIGDFTGDGKPDLAFVHDRSRNSYGAYDGAVLTVLVGDGRGGFTELPAHLLNRRGVALAGSADLNRDGRLDLLLQAGAFTQEGFDPTPELSVWPAYGTGEGTFSLGAVTPITAGGNLNPGNYLIRDLNGDGFPDAVYGNTTTGQIGLLTNDTTGNLRTTGQYGPTTGTYLTIHSTLPPVFLSADLNRDTIPDLVLFRSGINTSEIDIFLGKSTGGFRLAGSLDLSSSLDSRTVARNVTQVGDLNRDGIPDLVVGGRVWIGRGDGTFDQGQEVTRHDGSGAGGGTLVDVNQDGNLDLVYTMTNQFGYYVDPTGYCVYFGNGEGSLTFNPNTVITVPAMGIAMTIPPPVFDVTGDGIPDLLAIRRDSGVFLVLYSGRGNGTFGEAITSPIPFGLSSSTGATFVPLDYDRDGVIDLAGLTGNSSVVFLLRGVGGGVFAVGPEFNSQGLPVLSAAVGDFNRDGNPDLVVGGSLLSGDGAGQFASTPLGVGPVALLTGSNWVTGGKVTQGLPPAPPADQSVSVSTEQGRPVWVTPQSVPGVPRLIALATPPAHGTVRIDDNGTPTNPGDDRFVYTPATGYAGIDTWTYAVGNEGGTATGQVTVTVTANNQPTISDVPDKQTTADIPVGPVGFTVGDLETPAGNLVVTATSSNLTLIPIENIALGGSGTNRTVTVTPAAGHTGKATITLTVHDAAGATATDTFTVTVFQTGQGPGPGLALAREFAVGGGVGSVVRFFNPNGTERFAVDPFPGFTGGVRTASADFNGDGVADVVVGTGPGGPTLVLVLDGVTGAEVFWVEPFEAAFTGGVYVAAGDINGDGVPELVITPDEGGGPRARVFNGKGFAVMADFFGIADPNFRGGARAGIGDINGDGFGDLVVAAGFGGGPRTSTYDGSKLTVTGGPTLFGDFFAFEDTLRNGTFVSVGDIDGDGKAEMIIGAGPGGGPRVSAFSAVDLLTNKQTRIADFFAGDTNSRGGVRVAVKNLDGDNRADVIVGAGVGSGSSVTAYAGKNLIVGNSPELLFIDVFPGLNGGVFVG